MAGPSKCEASIGYLTRPCLKKQSSFRKMQETNLIRSSDTKPLHAGSVLSPHWEFRIVVLSSVVLTPKDVLLDSLPP